MQQLGGQRQTEFRQIQQQMTGYIQAGGHVVAAVQVGIVEHAFPAYRGPRLLHVRPHHDEGPVRQAFRKLGQFMTVFQGGLGIMERAGAGDDQQTRVFTIEDVANGLAVTGNL